MLAIDEMKKKRDVYERKIEEILKEFEKEIPPEFRIESVVALKPSGRGVGDSLKCTIKIGLAEDINK